MKLSTVLMKLGNLNWELRVTPLPYHLVYKLLYKILQSVVKNSLLVSTNIY